MSYALNVYRISQTQKQCHYCECALIPYDTLHMPPYYEKSKWGYYVLKSGYGLFTIDHKTPTSKGGDNGMDNLVACCAVCNSLKQAREYEEFKAWVLNERDKKLKKASW
jgi:hypothetical protein